MKKPLMILFSLITVLSLFSGCRRRANMVPATLPTQPAVTRPSENTLPDREDSTRETIEDGNGPIPSQKPAMK